MARKSTIGAGFSVPAPERDLGERDTVGRVLAGLPGGHAASVPSLDTPDNEASHMTDNMTSHMTVNTDGHMTDKQTDGSASQSERWKDGKKDSHTDELSGSQPGVPRVAASNDIISQTAMNQIMQSVRSRADAPPLKTVTIKMRVDRDDQVERHCFERKLKKQDVIENALALYFDAIAQIESTQIEGDGK